MTSIVIVSIYCGRVRLSHKDGLLTAVSCASVCFQWNSRLLLLLSANVTVDNVSKLCSRERNTLPLYKKIDGAVISSDMTDVELDCIMTFQTDTILQRFMLRFEELALDCNDHLFIFDGAHPFNPKVSYISATIATIAALTISFKCLLGESESERHSFLLRSCVSLCALRLFFPTFFASSSPLHPPLAVLSMREDQ